MDYLFIARHGDYSSNALSDLGKDQMAQLSGQIANVCGGLEMVLILSSDNPRAAESAEIVKKRLRLADIEYPEPKNPLNVSNLTGEEGRVSTTDIARVDGEVKLAQDSYPAVVLVTHGPIADNYSDFVAAREAIEVPKEELGKGEAYLFDLKSRTLERLPSGKYSQPQNHEDSQFSTEFEMLIENHEETETYRSYMEYFMEHFESGAIDEESGAIVFEQEQKEQKMYEPTKEEYIFARDWNTSTDSPIPPIAQKVPESPLEKSVGPQPAAAPVTSYDEKYYIETFSAGNRKITYLLSQNAERFDKLAFLESLRKNAGGRFEVYHEHWSQTERKDGMLIKFDDASKPNKAIVRVSLSRVDTAEARRLFGSIAETKTGKSANS